jgi:hypothetical protein
MKNSVVRRNRATRTAGRLAGRFGRVIGVLCIALHAATVGAADTAAKPTSAPDLSRLTIEELADIEISSVSRELSRWLKRLHPFT